jgi:RNA polymerase sigma factor (sigma-70 family)
MAVSETSHVASRTLDDLYRRHGPEVYRYALAVLGNHSDAEDVTQTTFLNAYRALEQGVRPRKPANWLLTIASNAIKQRFRQEQARPRQVELDRDVPAAGAEDVGPTVGELLTALSKIPPQQRQAIVLREFEGRTYKEIAEILGVTTSALETLLFRARRSLTDELAHQLTCTEAQQSVSRAADGRLGRKERRRLREHLTECPDCSQFARLQQRHRTALRGLALIPVPVSLTIFKGFEGSAAAATLPAAVGATAVGTGAGATAVGTSMGGTAAAGGGSVFAGGLAVKAAAVVAAASVAGGATVAGVKEIGVGGDHKRTPPAQIKGHGTGGEIRSQRATHASDRGLERGKAVARGQTGNVPPGYAQREANATTKSQGARATAKEKAHGQTTSTSPTRNKKTATPKEQTTPRGQASDRAEGRGGPNAASAESADASEASTAKSPKGPKSVLAGPSEAP